MLDHILRKLCVIRSKNLVVLYSYHIQYLVGTLHCQIAIFSDLWGNFAMKMSPKEMLKLQCGNALNLSLRNGFAKVSEKRIVDILTVIVTMLTILLSSAQFMCIAGDVTVEVRV
ncbi:hypothetical protein EVAR_8767_1 [Eumeta japonica]|uniref:Uncharacterized protein n=1 Tax=Eumeta variegata TaxID=151549 RepID=A0A4C1TTT2_EUMVA|nr:hypothetical protein EVAR_8767_1 [Eumeta japonica]